MIVIGVESGLVIWSLVLILGFIGCLILLFVFILCGSALFLCYLLYSDVVLSMELQILIFYDFFDTCLASEVR